MIDTPKDSYKVLKSSVFVPIFLACNDNNNKLVTLQTSWMHLQFVLVVFLIILCPREINGKLCTVSFESLLL